MVSIVVVLHLFYQDLWPEISEYLKNIDQEFDLCVSICKDHDQEIIKKIKEEYPKARILSLENQGADIGPFFEWMNILISEGASYDYLLKIHSKKCLAYAKKLRKPNISEVERGYSIKPLLETKEFVNRNLEILKDEKNGMVGSKVKFISDKERRLSPVLIEAENHMLYFTKNFEISTTKRSFFAGSMFWCKYKILSKYFSRHKIGIEYFEKGSHEKGRTAANAGERLFSRMFLNEGLELIGV